MLPTTSNRPCARHCKIWGVDYLDLYLIHWPVALRKDPSEGESQFIPLEELPLIDTWCALEKCVDKGLVNAIWRFQLLDRTGTK